MIRNIGSLNALLILVTQLALILLTSKVTGFALNGVEVKPVSRPGLESSTEKVDLGSFLMDSKQRSMLILGTYAADFNAIEYAQRLRYYLPKLKERGVVRFGLVLNCQEEAAKKLADAVDLDLNDEQLTLFVDPSGEAGRKFNVGRGWLPDDEQTSPYLKLFG